ncbi:hypothetical protein [Arthrobacter sp. NPDC090010]|uniref:EndoS/ChiA family endoglycosidase n=1 Tax=Arthrobacter sp. NPDC090010 TaxID=3363942 RepID=UPI00380EAACF
MTSTRRLRGLAASAVALATMFGTFCGVPANAAPASPGSQIPLGETAAGGSTGARTCSAPPVSLGYYRMWRDVATTKAADRAPNSQRMDDIPEEVDIVSMFATSPADDPDMWAAARDSYIPKLHAQGTDVIFTLFVDKIADASIPLTEASYEAYAEQLLDTYVRPYGLDGLDIDLERNLTADELTRASGVIRALSKSLGPKSGTGKYLILDTNDDGTHPLVRQAAPYIDYLLLQAYGRSAASLESSWKTFAPYISSCQFLPGFSFYEERGARWGDVNAPFDTSRAAAYARWQPQGGEKGGVFGYAVDRDGKEEGDDTITRSTFDWMKKLDGLIADVAIG